MPVPTPTPVPPDPIPLPLHWLAALWPHFGTLIAVIYALLIGASLASFLGVIADRVPRHLPISGRSHCVCARPLTPVELIPLVGWIWLRIHHHGNAPCCGYRVPLRYPVAEAFLATSAALCVGFLHFTVLSIVIIAAALVLTLFGLLVGSKSDPLTPPHPEQKPGAHLRGHPV